MYLADNIGIVQIAVLLQLSIRRTWCLQVCCMCVVFVGYLIDSGVTGWQWLCSHLRLVDTLFLFLHALDALQFTHLAEALHISVEFQDHPKPFLNAHCHRHVAPDVLLEHSQPPHHALEPRLV